jgi:GH15 family glucan-1,4-alpha-glucosidase
MPRDIPIGNGNYLVAFDQNYQIADIFFPHVGMQNHASGHIFRFGAFADGQFSWISTWKKSLGYVEDTLSTSVNLASVDLQLELLCTDCIDFVSPILLRSISIKNALPKDREIRLFFHHDFHLNGSSIGDTCYYDPVKSRALVHYKAETYFLMNCLTDSRDGIFQYACGVKEVGGSLGTWKDAEDGFLSGNPIAQGSVDSVISVRTILPASGTSTVYYWMVAGSNYDQVERRDGFVKQRTPQALMKRTMDYWRLWSRKEPLRNSDLETDVYAQFKRSLLTCSTQTDANGAIIAANDTDILQMSRDTYSYMWPRDASLVTSALDEAGYHVFSRRFFEFCSKVILSQGWFFHKYQPDGSAGSSWHPWISAGEMQLPIQEDETALVVSSLWNHFERNRDVDFIKQFYRPVVKSAAAFMLEYRDPIMNLPLPSYDLWEERRGVFTFTCSAVYQGLLSASKFCAAFGEQESAQTYAQAAEEIKQAVLKNLYDPALGRFLRGVQLEAGKIVAFDQTVDSSLAGIFVFGVLPADDPRVASTMKQVEQKLTVQTRIGGLARYEQDRYQAVENYDSTIPGNPWFVTTLWLCDWYIEVAKSRADLSEAKAILKWATNHTLPSGIMAEQLNPFDGSPISVSPLTWSHGAYVDTVNRYIKKFNSLYS